MLRGQLPPLKTIVGTVVVCDVDVPEWGASGPDRYTHVYVAVVTEPNARFLGQNLAMLVKINDPREAPDVLREDPDPRWDWLRSPWKPTLEDVYARENFRVRAAPADRPAVQVGRQLVATGLLGRHSTRRSEKGSEWAEAVGGEIPQLVDRDTGTQLAGNAERVLVALERELWWRRL
ncbi:hypothetical protein [Streptomyces sp. NPDC005548]|uniref:hypothetical protein n=1 Tax=Streptomyces sp. NPDC005548 TaxID=3364724 RepID=UPI003683A462